MLHNYEDNCLVMSPNQLMVYGTIVGSISL